jgi:hypothetical protein
MIGTHVRFRSDDARLAAGFRWMIICGQVDPRRKDPDDKPPSNPIRMPVIDTDKGQMDVISRLLKDRILLLGQGVDDEVANVLVAQLLYLANEDPKKDITLYINSPGGSVSAGMAIYDSTCREIAMLRDGAVLW